MQVAARPPRAGTPTLAAARQAGVPSRRDRARIDCRAQPTGRVHEGNAGASRRSLLASTALLSALAPVLPPAAVAGRRLQKDPRVKPLQQFWQQCVAHLQGQLGDGFAPMLVFYGPGEVLPSGAPGDPALEYNRRAAPKCGPFTSGFAQPYPLCPLKVGGVAADDAARDCCRHFAYAVPRSRYAFAAIDRQTSVVASPRLALADAATWRGVLTHEMGHCIDFYAFPGRYQLPSEAPPRSAAAAAALGAIDADEPDAELRADRMANALLALLLGQQLCYDRRTHVQSLVPTSTVCLPEAAPSSSADRPPGPDDAGAAYMQHFPHPPVSV